MKPTLQKSFMNLHECYTIEKYMDLRITNRKVGIVKRKSGPTKELHGTALTDAIGLVYKPNIEQIFGEKLSLTNSILKRTYRDGLMDWHRNKWQFEYVAVIQISDNLWPIGFQTDQDSPYVEGLQNEAGAVLTAQQGDAILFNGAVTYHGRQRLKDDKCTVLMLYYVEEDGFLDNKAERELYGDEHKTKITPFGGLKIDA